MAPLFYIDALAVMMAGLVVFVALIVASFSRRYMAGDAGYDRFFKNLGGVTLATLILVSTNHMILFWAAWLTMGWLLSRLIGHVKSWPPAQAAAKLAWRHCLLGNLALGGAFALLYSQTGSLTIKESLSYDLTYPWQLGIGGLLIAAALIQSAVIPFHRWLTNSMTAPTPVSALMHAGLINAGGFLIIRFHPLFTSLPEALLVLFTIGLISALIGSLWMSVQPDIKRSLGCSTVAQMGFMMVQCGLGFYSAALAHLILHGFFKAYHFLNAGSAISQPTLPTKPSLPQRPPVVILIISLLIAGGAGILFASATNKPLTLALALTDTGSLLTLFVAAAAGLGSYRLLSLEHLNLIIRTGLAVSLIGLTTLLYATLFIYISRSLPIDAPQSLTVIHVIITGFFFTVWMGTLLHRHRNSARLYMVMLNSSQPVQAAVTPTRHGIKSGGSHAG